MTPLSLVPEQAQQKGISYGELVERIIAEALQDAQGQRGGGDVSAAHVRRGASSRSRKASSRVSVPKKLAAKLPVKQAEANRLAGWAFGLFVAGDRRACALIALDVPDKLGRGRRRGGRRRRLPGEERRRPGHSPDGPRPVYEIALDQKTTAMPLVDVSDIRSRLLEFGWVKDARVSRRFPDTLVIDIVERTPAALWQDEDRLTLIDAEGRGARPRAGQPDARPAAVDRQGRQRPGGAARALARTRRRR